MKQYLQDYEESLREDSKAEGSIKVYSNFLKSYFKKNDLSSSNIRSYFTNSKLSPATFNLYKAILLGYCDWCISRGYMENNPVRNLRLKTKAKRSLPKPLSAEDWDNFYKKTHGWFRIVCGLMRYGGLRLSESATITKNSLIEENGLYWVRVEQGKGGVDRDSIITDKQFCGELKIYIAPLNGCDNLAKGRSTSTIRNKFRSINKNIHPHLLRHTYATELANNGTPLELIQLMLGHARLETTLIYAQIRPERILKYVI